MNANAASLVTHAGLLALVIVAALILGMAGRIGGGEALAVIAAAGGVGVVGAIGVSVGSKGSPPEG